MTTEISGMYQTGGAAHDLVAELRERRIVFARRLANEPMRYAVGRPLLRVQPEVAMFEGDDRGPSDRTCDMSRTGVDGDDHAGNSEDRRPLMERQPPEDARYARRRFEVRRQRLTLFGAGHHHRGDLTEPLDERQGAPQGAAGGEPPLAQVEHDRAGG